MRKFLVAVLFVSGCARSAVAPKTPAEAGSEEAASAPTPSAAAAASAPAEASSAEPDEEADDTGDSTTSPNGRTVVIELTDQEIQDRLRRDPASLGPMSLGMPNAGVLVNGVDLPASDRWDTPDPSHAWGTQETIDGLARAIDKVHERYPDAPKLEIGHISSRGGGHLSPHKSHQAGRDVDVGYFYSKSARFFERATAANLDCAKTWAFVRALITETDVEMILIDSSIQKLLRDYALSHGEDAAWIDDVFQYGSRQPHPIIRHIKGHTTHLHVRFFSPRAQELGRRALRFLPQYAHMKVAPVSDAYVEHRARHGDTLGSLARRYGTSVEAIQRANGLKSTHIQEKAVYRIPRAGAAPPQPPTRALIASGPVVIPPRRLPPKRAGAASPTTAGPQL